MNLLKKVEGVSLINFQGGPGIPLLNFEGVRGSGVPVPRIPGLRIPLLNHAIFTHKNNDKNMQRCI